MESLLTSFWLEVVTWSLHKYGGSWSQQHTKNDQVCSDISYMVSEKPEFWQELNLRDMEAKWLCHVAEKENAKSCKGMEFMFFQYKRNS